jgi:hypothetical protein
MTCKEIRELLPDMALGEAPVSGEMDAHLRSCAECAGKLEGIRATMALMDEWEAPEPSPYFDVRLNARLREEKAKAPSGWLAWMRKPVLAVAASTALALGVGVAIFRGHIDHRGPSSTVAVGPITPGTPVGDLQALDQDHDLYSDFDVLDDLDVQTDGTANP